MSLEDNWTKIRQTLDHTVSIAWDTCHKIYLLLDEEQHSLMMEYGYDPIYRVNELGVEKAYTILRDWYDSSCGLRFISSVVTVPGNANDGFNSLISQFDDEDDDWDES